MVTARICSSASAARNPYWPNCAEYFPTALAIEKVDRDETSALDAPRKPARNCGHFPIIELREMTHRGEADYGRHINAIVLR